MPNVEFFTRAGHMAHLLTQHAPPDFKVRVHPMGLPAAEQAALVPNADFLILFPSVAADEALRAAPNLKLIQLVAAGFDSLNVELCKQLGVPVANNGGANAIDVAEHTLMLMLSFYRRLTEMDRAVRSGEWRAMDSGSTTYTLHNKTIGIIGLGNIGRQTAQRLAPFGARLLYYDAYPQPAETETRLGVTRVTLDTLLAESDIVTLHTPLNADTHHLIDARALGLMKPNAVLVNTCRGPVVDEAALTDALIERRIAGAALDVLETEPPAADNPLLKLDNVLLSPHTAGVTYDTWSRRGEFIFMNLQRVWNGESPLAVIA